MSIAICYSPVMECMHNVRMTQFGKTVHMWNTNTTEAGFGG